MHVRVWLQGGVSYFGLEAAMADSTSDDVWNDLPNTLLSSDHEQLNQIFSPMDLAAAQVWFSDESNNLHLSPMGDNHQSRVVEDFLSSQGSEPLSSPTELDVLFNKIQGAEDGLRKLQYE